MNRIMRWIKGFFKFTKAYKSSTDKDNKDKTNDFVETESHIGFEKRDRFYVPPNLRRY